MVNWELKVKSKMVETDLIETKKGAALGIIVKLPHDELKIIRAEKGYLVCGYFNPKTIEKFKDAAVIITPSGRTFKEMLKKKVTYVSKQAKKLKIKKGMTGLRALDKMI